MAISQRRPKQKQTGAKYKALRKKRKSDLGRLPTMTKLGERACKAVRTLGGNTKQRLMHDNKLTVYDRKEKKSFTLAIKTVLENPANRHYVRRNIMTKGTIVETERGKVRITSRPGQDGTLCGVLI